MFVGYSKKQFYSIQLNRTFVLDGVLDYAWGYKIIQLDKLTKLYTEIKSVMNQPVNDWMIYT